MAKSRKSGMPFCFVYILVFKFFILLFYFVRCLKLFADDFDSMLKSILDDDDKPKRKSSLAAATGSPNATIQPSDKKDEQSTSAGCC